MSRKKKTWIILIAAVFALGLIALLLRPYYLNITFGISDFFRDLGLKSPAEIVRVDDQRYGEDPMQVLDVYYPAGTEEKLPTIVSIHGGGYIYGTKETYQYYCMSLAQRGFTVVNYSYRLGPKHKFPAQLEDTNAVLRFVCENAEQYHIDTDCVFFVGDSAGGHLNAQYSAAVTNPEYAALLGLEIPAFRLRATALNCGVFRLEDLLGSREMLSILEGDPARYEEQWDILGHITADFPPAFVMSATGDMCLPYARPMAEYLHSVGVEAELHIYGDASNRLPHVFHVNVKSEDAARCNDEECAFFRAHMDDPGE